MMPTIQSTRSTLRTVRRGHQVQARGSHLGVVIKITKGKMAFLLKKMVRIKLISNLLPITEANIKTNPTTKSTAPKTATTAKPTTTAMVLKRSYLL